MDEVKPCFAQGSTVLIKAIAVTTLSKRRVDLRKMGKEIKIPTRWLL